MKEDILGPEMSPDEADRFWKWLNEWRGLNSPTEIEQINILIRSLPEDDPIPSRNAPCPCGSGKKYKKCCGKL